MAPRRGKNGILQVGKLLSFPHSGWLLILKFQTFGLYVCCRNPLCCWTIETFGYSRNTLGVLCAGKHQIMAVQYVCSVLSFLLILLCRMYEETRRRGARIVKDRNLNMSANPYVGGRRNGGKSLILGMSLR